MLAACGIYQLTPLKSRCRLGGDALIDTKPIAWQPNGGRY
jgi:hypothetical protein